MSYSTKLNPNILSRARIILGSLLALTTILIVAGIYQGVQTGDLDRVLVKPFREFGTSFDQVMNTTPSGQTSLELVVPTPTEFPIVPAPVKSNKTYTTPAQPAQQTQPTSTAKTYDQIKAEQDAWWADVQKQNAELSKQSQAELDAFRQQSQQNLKNSEAKGQAGLEQFRKESEQKMAEFRQKYGVQ